MALTLYWLQVGACGGDTMSLLNAVRPDLNELFVGLGVEVLWQPSLSNGSAADHRRVVDAILGGNSSLDILCVEGSVVRGPGGTGRFDVWNGTPKKDLVASLARRARHVIAVGTCASFGGIPVEGPSEATGLQFHRGTRGGFLGEAFVSGSGQPVINLPGCPAHTEPLCSTLTLLARGNEVPLTELGTPADWYGTLVHQGCTRNDYHEFRVEERVLGTPGCLYFHLGCLGPLTWGPCNRTLWAGRNSKTRSGMPCFGCMRPDFPRPHPFFETRNIEGVPIDLPDGVDRPHFLAYKSLAAASAPQRLLRRINKV